MRRGTSGIRGNVLAMRFTSAEIADATGGTASGPDVVVEGVSIDSRLDVAGRLFVPIVAERDGHDFIASALDGGAAAYLTSRRPQGGTAISVDDTSAALTALGRAARSRIDGPVVGITGSVGKTSVKDMLRAVLAEAMPTAASERNFNNELGVPLTLANMPDDVRAAVVEMGARGIGHIAELCGIASPTIGIVTVVAAVHTEVFGSIDDVAIGKGELVEALPAHGTAVLNAEDARVRAMASRTSANVMLYGEDGDVVAENVRLDEELQPSFVLRTPDGSIDIALGARGVHQVSNALAVASAAIACGVTLDSVAAGLAKAQLSPWRMEFTRTAAGAVVINDAYNASPTSVEAALRSLALVTADRRIAVLGTMAELGDHADEGHARVGELARELGVEVIAVSEDRYGVEPVEGIDEALQRLEPLGRGDAVLLKGSRVAGLERLADLLLS